MKNISLILIGLLFPFVGFAQVISTNSQEVQFSYETEFEAAANSRQTPEAQALDHSNYLFGVMHSPELTQMFNLDSDNIEGTGSPRSDVQIKVLNVDKSPSVTRIRYSIKGLMLVHDAVAKKILKAGGWDIPMPINADKAFSLKCTDEHYQTFGDYWYFWNPYRNGCQFLLKNPMTNLVRLKIQAPTKKKLEQTARLDLLRGANGNGKLLSIYVVHGFSEDPKDLNDENRVTYEEFSRFLTDDRGFEEKVKYSGLTRPLKIYTKSITLPNGQEIDVEIKSLLVDTGMETKSKVFAKFFAEAVEKADVIYYSGHSGLGSNLSIPDLQAKVPFTFPKNKRQIFYFEACSSYSYYLSTFAAEKTKAKIDILTNALASYFETGNAVLGAFVDVLINPKIQDIKWINYLRAIEKPMNGRSYLLSVGGV